MIVAVANQKGGVGKTTTVANLAAAFEAEGRRVLALDLDPQASLTFYLGHDETALEAAGQTLYHALVGGMTLAALVIRSAAPGTEEAPSPGDDDGTDGRVDLVPASIALAKAEAELLSEPNGAMVLAELLAPLAAAYDLVLLDCPPSLGMLTVNALNAADAVLIPVKTQLLSLIGLSQILETIRKVRRRANPRLKVLGILPTMHHARHAHDAEVLREIALSYQELPIFEPVPSTTRLARQAGAAVPGSHGASAIGHDAYARLAARLLEEPDAPAA